MVLRPKNQEPQAHIPDVNFVEELVRKSLAINKDLRAGESTTKYLKHLREQVRQQAQGGAEPPGGASKAPGPPSAPEKSQLERKTATLSTFLESKAVDFDGQHQAIRHEREKLDAQEKALRDRFVDALTDMLTLVTDGEDLSAFREVLAQHRTFLSQLGIRDVDLLKAVKKRA